MSTKSDRLPALPPGFVLQQPDAETPPLPPGFVLEGQEEPADRNTFMGKVDTAVRGAADFLSVGLADEIAAAGDAAFNPVFGTGKDGGSFSERYDANLADQRATDEADANERFGYRLGGQVAGGVGGAVGLAKVGGSLAARAAQNGRGWFVRMLGGAADGGLQAGAYGFGSGEGTRDRIWNAARNAPLGVAIGAGGEGIATGVGAAWRRAFQGAGDVAPGANPAAIVADAQEFGIPLSRAQATRSVPQANIENQLRSQGAMQAFDQAQREAVDASVGAVQSRLAAGQPGIPSPAAAYEGIPGKLRGVRDSLKAASQDAYEASVNNPNVLVDGEAVRALPDFIRGRLEAGQILIDPMYHQGASRAMSFLDDYLGRLPQIGDDVKGVRAQLRWVENMRAGLRKNFPPIGQDAPALKAISGAIDDWTDEVFEKGLVSASDDVLSELKTARAKWSEYQSMVNPKTKIGNRLNPQYEAQATVRKVMDKELSPEEVGQMLFGTSVAKPKNTGFMTAQLLRKQLGPDSSEWNGVRQSFWLRATRAGDEAMSPAQIAKNLDGLLNGDGKGVSQVLYSAAERDLMTKYLGTMRALTPAREGFNNSNTANRLMPQLARYGNAIMAALAGGGGLYGGLDPLAAVGVGAITSGAMKGLGAAAKAGRLSAATRMPVPVNPSGVGGAALRGIGTGGLGELQRHRPLEITVTPRR